MRSPAHGFACPLDLKGPSPFTAAATTSLWARPDSTPPSLTESKLSIVPSLVRALTINPGGPQTFAASQRLTPGGWLISPAIASPTGKKVPVVEPVAIWKDIRGVSAATVAAPACQRHKRGDGS